MMKQCIMDTVSILPSVLLNCTDHVVSSLRTKRWITKVQQHLRSVTLVMSNNSSTAGSPSTTIVPRHHYRQQQQPQVLISQVRTMVYTTLHEYNQPIRRIRKPYTKLKSFNDDVNNKKHQEQIKKNITLEHLQLPYAHGEVNIEAYLEKTSLSPWVPIPDSAARKMMDLGNVNNTDYHIDFGCGDGRVNFHAIDYSNVSTSIGIDIDEHIIAIAQERKQKRHPIPTNIQFIIADLLKDTNHPLWDDIIQNATVITMYFATEALHLFKPILESKLKCIPKHRGIIRIITAGYSMPGWIYQNHEVVNALPLYLYEWGTFYNEEDVDMETNTLKPLSLIPPPTTGTDDIYDDAGSTDAPLNNNDNDVYDPNDDDGTENVVESTESEYIPLIQHPFEKREDKLHGANVIDRTNQLGYNPNYKQEEDEWDYDWDDDISTTSTIKPSDSTNTKK